MDLVETVVQHSRQPAGGSEPSQSFSHVQTLQTDQGDSQNI